MTPFLQRIAKAYCAAHSRGEMADFCFVFPNKRSATFFRHFLGDAIAGDAPLVEPAITTISDFIAELSDCVVASRYDLLFTLYKLYSRLSPAVEEFDRFVFWGDMLLGDFNDTDLYMADASQLFRNLKHYKEINADYLTPKQKEIINKYWGEQLAVGEGVERFWTHVDAPGEPRANREAFMRLWELLEPLYEQLRASLAKRGLCYPGMQYREVAEKLAAMRPDELPYRRVVMVGFNVLSIAELSIFARLHELGVGDFYWDFDFPPELHADNVCTRFIARYAKLLPSRYDIGSRADSGDDGGGLPEITVVGIPSGVGQAKYAGRLLEEMAADGRIADPANAIDTAVVLPSEDLFIELLHSLPPSLTSVNITMGYPMKLTPAAALMRSVMNLHLKARKAKGQWQFFYEDVSDVLANSLTARIAPKECEEIRTVMVKNRLYNLTADFLHKKEWERLSPLFYPVTDLHDGPQVFDYTLRLTSFLEQELKKADAAPLELAFLARYRQSVEQLRDVALRYGIAMREATFFHLIRSVVDAEKVNFTGEPLKGLQVMGILETRALNFDNLIILSMNERIFPRRHFARTFIPNLLRRAFGLSTMEFQESMFAYHFYRMVASARRVTLLYDTRTEGLTTGDMSRYIQQLRYRYPKERLRMLTAAYHLPPPAPDSDVAVVKDDEIMAKINRYRAPVGDPERKCLSPSAINTFLSCPLKFALHYLRNLSDDDEVTDYMDESTFGKVLHQVAEYTYNQLRGDRSEVVVTAEMLDALTADRVGLDKLITSAINRHYNHLPNLNPDVEPDEEPYINLNPLNGEARVIGDIMGEQMRMLFRVEKLRAPFTFICAERDFDVVLNLAPQLSVNLRGVVDRVDRRGDRLEIIDYKTGGDEINASQLAHLFEPAGKDKVHNKALLQLFLYCNALRNEKRPLAGSDGPMRPMLLRFRKLSGEESAPQVVISKNPIDDYRELNDEVLAELGARLAPLFDPATPLRPTPNASHCRYCNFKALCGKSVKPANY